MSGQLDSVAGRGVAELPVPTWVKFARVWLTLGITALILSGCFAWSGWSWVTEAGADGFSAGFAFWVALVVTAAIAAPLLLARSGALSSFLVLRRLADGR